MSRINVKRLGISMHCNKAYLGAREDDHAVVIMDIV